MLPALSRYHISYIVMNKCLYLNRNTLLVPVCNECILLYICCVFVVHSGTWFLQSTDFTDLRKAWLSSCIGIIVSHGPHVCETSKTPCEEFALAGECLPLYSAGHFLSTSMSVNQCDNIQYSGTAVLHYLIR
jgi:hypothetical protein